MKFEVWKKKDLKGKWEVSYKIDGVRCHNTPFGFMSRADKPLYNIPKKKFTVAEIFCGSFKETIENTRTFTKVMTITEDQVFPLLPKIDKRLLLGVYTDLKVEKVQELFEQAKTLGHEGLVLRQGSKYIKVKSEETFDVKIEGLFEGKGRNKGRLGKFLSSMGGVGTGLSDKEREEYWDQKMISQIIEVKCMELTPDGKFRHPRFVRLREDKK